MPLSRALTHGRYSRIVGVTVVTPVDLHFIVLADGDGARIAVDLHLVVLADRDGVHIVLVA